MSSTGEASKKPKGCGCGGFVAVLGIWVGGLLFGVGGCGVCLYARGRTRAHAHKCKPAGSTYPQHARDLLEGHERPVLQPRHVVRPEDVPQHEVLVHQRAVCVVFVWGRCG